MSETVLETIGLTKHYHTTVALDNLSLSVHRGEVFGCLGPNGSGKTTTVKLILGLVKPTAGAVMLFGEPAKGNRQRLLRRVSAIVEAPAFYPYLSGRDNLKVLATIDGRSDSEIDEVLRRVDLHGAAHSAFETYSVGMKQRLGIAAALLRQPDLVILDEPTSGLDPAGQREVRELIPYLAREGCGVFLSSHMMHEVQEICDRVGILRQGRLLRVGNVTDLLIEQGVIEVRTDEHQRAVEILEAVDWIEHIDCTDGKLVLSAPTDRSADVNRELAKAGIYVAELRPRERSLEDVFLEITQTGGES